MALSHHGAFCIEYWGLVFVVFQSHMTVCALLSLLWIPYLGYLCINYIMWHISIIETCVGFCLLFLWKFPHVSGVVPHLCNFLFRVCHYVTDLCNVCVRSVILMLCYFILK